MDRTSIDITSVEFVFVLRCKCGHSFILVDMLSQTLRSCLVALTSKVAVFALPSAPYNQMGN